MWNGSRNDTEPRSVPPGRKDAPGFTHCNNRMLQVLQKSKANDKREAVVAKWQCVRVHKHLGMSRIVVDAEILEAGFFQHALLPPLVPFMNVVTGCARVLAGFNWYGRHGRRQRRTRIISRRWIDCEFEAVYFRASQPQIHCTSVRIRIFHGATRARNSGRVRS